LLLKYATPGNLVKFQARKPNKCQIFWVERDVLDAPKQDLSKALNYLGRLGRTRGLIAVAISASLLPNVTL
jgi:hypothetical protein